jgi:hypothetical protein
MKFSSKIEIHYNIIMLYLNKADIICTTIDKSNNIINLFIKMNDFNFSKTNCHCNIINNNYNITDFSYNVTDLKKLLKKTRSIQGDRQEWHSIQS